MGATSIPEPPLDLNSAEFNGLRKYFGKESIQRQLRALKKESVYTAQELKAMEEQAKSENKKKQEDQEETSFHHRFGGNKQIQDVYLREDKRRKMREFLAQAKIFCEIEEKKRDENWKKQALELRLKKEMVDKVKEFDRQRQHLNSYRSVMGDRKFETRSMASAKSGSKSARTARSEPTTSSCDGTRRKASSKSGKDSLKLNLAAAADVASPRPGNNMATINYADSSGLAVPVSVDVDDIDPDYLDEAAALTYRDSDWEEDNDYMQQMPRKNYSAQNTPRSAGASSVRTGRTAGNNWGNALALDGNYFATISAPAVRNIGRNFETSARSKFTPRDFTELQNAYGIKLRPIQSAKVVSSLIPKLEPLPKIKFTREKIRYPPHPPKTYVKENINSNVKLTLRYNGVPTKVVAIPEEGHKIQVTHQPGSGTNYVIFSGYVHPGSAMDIVSKRLPGHPFSITIFIQGYADTRVSTCCEFRHQEGFKIGGRLGRFTVEKITGDPELKCYKCKLHDFEAMPKLKKLIAQDKRKHGNTNQPSSQQVPDGAEDQVEDDDDDVASVGGVSESSFHSATAKEQDQPDSFNETKTSDKTHGGGAMHSETFSDSDTKSETLERNSATSITYKVTLVATNLELARDCTVTLRLMGDKKKQLLFELENPFRKVLKMNVTQSFIGTRIGKVTKLEVTSDSGEYTTWFLKDVIIEYGSYKSSFKCERWIGLSEDGRELFSECHTQRQSHNTAKSEQEQTEVAEN